ncbi:MAG: cysteine desulfurase family protein [Candidatus Methylacidiphilales bacterium]
MRRPLHLDAIATTPLATSVREAMLPFLEGLTGHPGGVHSSANRLDEAKENARQLIRAFSGATESGRVIFTGSGTEAVNLAVMGWARARAKPAHIVSTLIEHPALDGALARLRKEGHRITFIPVDANGFPLLEELERCVRKQPIDLLATHLAHYEIGTRQNVIELGKFCRRTGARFFLDATHGMAWNPLSMADHGVDLLAFSPHRFFGPAGVGVLVAATGIPLAPLYDGGMQEEGLRPGTGSVPLIVGAGAACDLAMREAPTWQETTQKYQHQFKEILSSTLEEIRWGGPEPGLQRDPHHLQLSVGYVESEAVALFADLRGVQFTSGTGCLRPEEKGSRTLRVLGMEPEFRTGNLIFGLLPDLTDQDVEDAAGVVVQAVQRVRSMSPGWMERANRSAGA